MLYVNCYFGARDLLFLPTDRRMEWIDGWMDSTDRRMEWMDGFNPHSSLIAHHPLSRDLPSRGS